MQCNIDARGKSLRLIAGAIVESIGLLLLVLAFIGVVPGAWPWIVGAAAAAGGTFMIFEGIAGWCAIRAMGVRTPI